MKKLPVVVLATWVAVVPYTQASDAELADDKGKVSYIVGYQIGQQLRNDGMDIDAGALKLGVEDVMSGKSSRMSSDEMKAVMSNYEQQQNEKRESMAKTNLETGNKFLAENKGKAGVVELDNGLQYKVIKAGAGKKPAAEDTVTVHYSGRLIDGTEFDSSYKRGEPANFPVNRVIPGWTQILQMMEEGANWQVYIPAALAYGERGAGAVIGPNSMLIFDIELLKINK
ncbi:MAG: hypothetical protein A2V90_00220 [Gammaproteobacteria bacterium RBG_16_57_12]|nr:MAG: hypothetical protein A2V90_00220 [Gammaproteobacteria bacterium RBG_16_57_12]